MPNISNQLIKVTAGVFQAGFVILGGYLVARAVVLWSTPEAAWTAPLSVPQAQDSRGATRLVLPSGVDPFHRDLASPMQLDPVVTAPETSLSLTLVGRRFGQNATAQIRLPSGTQLLVREGDEVMSGVTLEAVYADYVLISQGGTTERLSFKREESNLRMPIIEDAIPLSEAPLMTLSEYFAQQNTVLGDKSDTTRAAEMIGQALSFNEVRHDGRRLGYRVSARHESLKLSQFGLKSNDIITSINGEDLTLGRHEFDAILMDATRQDSLNLKILRDERVVTVRVPIK